MKDEQKFIEEFVAAAKAEDGEKMKAVSEEVTEMPAEDRADLLEKLVEAMKKEEVNEEITSGLAGTLELMRAALKSEQNSAGEEAKDNTEAGEATQDVAADTSAEAEGSTKAEEGEAPAEEKKAEKTEQ